MIFLIINVALPVLGAVGCVLAIVAEMRRKRAREHLFYAERSEASWEATALAAEARLAAIRRQRSNTVRRGNATRKAREATKRAETTSRLESGL